MDLDTFHQKLCSHPLPVVVDIWAPWCGPCRMIEPALHKLSQEFAGRVDVWKINADENVDLVRSLRVYGIPALLVFSGTREITRASGAQPQASLAKLFEAALKGEVAQNPIIPLAERLLRGVLGLSLIIATWVMDLSPILYALGAFILFAAVHDRCPVWQALSPRLSNWIGQVSKGRFPRREGTP